MMSYYRPNLPSFDQGKGGGAVLSQRDSELLISYLTGIAHSLFALNCLP
jgi:hypothetical protein